MLLHSHNDYLRERPLFDALEQKFDSVEADVFLVDGKLLVAHERASLKPERTFESLYLKPLSLRKDKLWVLVDIKADGTLAYEKVKEEIARYPQLRDRVKFVISGDRPLDAMRADKGRFAGYDGRWADLDKGYSKSFMPWVSESWISHFKWRGNGPFNEMVKLKEMVKRVHDQGRLLRFWVAPDGPNGWGVLREAGVDLVGTDRPVDLRKWSREAVNTDTNQVLEAALLGFFSKEPWVKANWDTPRAVSLNYMYSKSDDSFEYMLKVMKRQVADRLKQEPSWTTRFAALTEDLETLESVNEKAAVEDSASLPLPRMKWEARIRVVDLKDEGAWLFLDRQNIPVEVQKPAFTVDRQFAIISMMAPWSMHAASLKLLMKREGAVWKRSVVTVEIWL